MGFEEVQRGFLSDRKGKVNPCRGTEGRKGTGTNSGKSGTTDLESEGIRSRTESTRRCVRLETVTETRRSSARNAFVAQTVYLYDALHLHKYECMSRRFVAPR